MKLKQADLEKSQPQADSMTDENQSSDNETVKELPLEGVVCWGDSLTAGLAGGYPKVLEECLKESGNMIPVEMKVLLVKEPLKSWQEQVRLLLQMQF